MLIRFSNFFFILAETLRLPESNTGSGLVGHSKITMLTALSFDKHIIRIENHCIWVYFSIPLFSLSFCALVPDRQYLF